MSKRFDIFMPDDCKSVLCALSGGADSVFLLSLLKSISGERGIRVCAAHYEHGIRGEESLRDADFAAKLCESLNVEYRIEHGNVPEYALQCRKSTEEAARELRYEFLARARKELGCDYIATAHNADDNAETMLFNLTRGSGSKGLCGIPKLRGNIIRPILGITRAEIETYLEENHIPHVEDSSNESDDYSRNLIRHRVMPVLREINPGFLTASARTAELMRQDDDCLGTLAREFVGKNFDGESIPARALSALHPAIASRAVRLILGQNTASIHVNSILALAAESERSFADIPGRRIRAEQGRIYFTEEKSIHIPEREIVIGEVLEIPETGAVIKSSVDCFDDEVHDSLNTFSLKYENICSGLICGGRRAGDSFAPMNRGCTKTLKSLFVEKKLTQCQRDSVLVFRDGQGIAAVAGFGIDRRFTAKNGDKIVKIEIEYKEK